ncbi:MAG: TRAP transporter permease [Burkholderiaceae bacterium]
MTGAGPSSPAAAAPPRPRIRLADIGIGPRRPPGRPAALLVLVALAWAVFQLWVASPLPERLGVLVFNQATIRSLHLAFAVAIAFLAYPASKRVATDRVSVADGVLAVLAAASAGFLALFYASITAHTGAPTGFEVAIAALGMALLLEATRRVLGLPMVLLALAMMGYILFGAWMPDLIAHKGASFAHTMTHMWLTTEGVFGAALGISAGLIFLFVLFGALLETAGAGSYFIRCAVALVGHLRGGPAKAAVLASAATGMISGSSITNVVTTGPLTIPLIKRVGYPPEKAAAIEVAASVNGQVMPPVMGAAAFLMVEYVGVPYVQVLKHALISAMVSYLGLLYIVHLEAVKADLRGLPRRPRPDWQHRVDQFALGFVGLGAALGLAALSGAVVHLLVPQMSFAIMAVLLLGIYVVLLRASARHGVTAAPDADAPIRRMPELGPTLRSGMYFLLPMGALVWNLVIEQLSPVRAAFWATMFLVCIVLTQRPLLAWFRNDAGAVRDAAWRGVQDLVDGLAAGARNMVIVAIATATAGIIVGTLTLTGVGLVMTELVTALSGGNIIAMLVLVALICLVLGMGLPTTASYIVVSSLLAPVIVDIGAQNGLLVPLIAAHLFVFYFGLMADITPPVGLASYAAASIAYANPIRTGVVAFRYSMRMALLPFMFVLNPQLLLIGVSGVFHTVITVASATLAGFAFISVNQGWLLVRSTRTERLVLLLTVFMLFHPGLFLDPLVAPYRQLRGPEAEAAIVAAPRDAQMRMFLSGTTIEGESVERGVLLPLGAPAADAVQRLAGGGIRGTRGAAGFAVDSVVFGSPAARLGIEPGFQITAVEIPNERLHSEWMFVPALGLIGWVVVRQRRRRDATAAVPA